MKTTKLLLAIGLALGSTAAFAQATPATPATPAAPAAKATAAAKPMHKHHRRHRHHHQAAAKKVDDATKSKTG